MSFRSAPPASTSRADDVTGALRRPMRRLSLGLSTRRRSPPDASGPRNVVVAAHSHNFEPWQLQRLDEAFAAGKRNIKVNDLARELELDRGTVLQWFKEHEVLPKRVRDSLREAHETAVQAENERTALLQQAAAAKKAAAEAAAAAEPAMATSLAERRKAFYSAKRLGWDVEATLEKVYLASPRGWPSDEMLDGLLELHRAVPRKRIMQWFADRRKADGFENQRRQGGGRGRGGRSVQLDGRGRGAGWKQGGEAGRRQARDA